MPEGDSVAVMTNLVRSMILGKKIIRLCPLPGCKPTGIGNTQVEANTVSAVESNGKLMWITLTNGLWIFSTFGLAGGWCLGESTSNRFELTCEDGTRLFFRDGMNYGGITVTDDPKIFAKKMKERGFDLFGNMPLTYDTFMQIVRKAKKINICDFLLTKQNLLSGVGNVLKCEILYRAGISPWRTIDSLTDAELHALYDSINAICQHALQCNGRAYRYTDLIPREVCTFEQHFSVYEKQIDSLGNSVLCEKTPDGRKSYWVKGVQN